MKMVQMQDYGGGELWVNPDTVAYVTQYQNGATSLHFVGSKELTVVVKETASQAAAKLTS